MRYQFDINKAIAAGYTPEQANQYMAAQQAKGKQYDALPATPAEMNAQNQQGGHWTDILPIAGAIGGSFLPGLGTIAGGAVGAGIGALAKHAFDEKEGLDIADVGKEAALGGVGGVVGKGIGAVGGKVLSKMKGVSGSFDDAAKGLKQGTRQIKQPASVFGADKEKAINKTLDKYAFRGTAQQQYESLEPTMQKIEGEIQKLIIKNPTLSASKEEIKKSFLTNLKSSLRSKDLTEAQAIKEIDGYLTDLLKASGGTGKFTNIPIGTLRNLKKLVNEDYGPAYAIMERGGALTPRQKVIVAAWGSLDDAVKNVSPEIKDLLVDESNLYRAARSLSGARSNPPTLRVGGTSVPQVVTQGIRDVGAAGAGTASKVLSKVPGQLPSIQNQAVGQSVVRLPFAGSGMEPTLNNGEYNGQNNPQNNGNPQYSQNNTAGYGQHMPEIIPQALPQSQDPGFLPGETPQQWTQRMQGGQSTQQSMSLPENPQDAMLGTLNPYGASPEKLYAKYIEALSAGDKGNAALLKQMWEDETEYQKANVVKPKPQNAKQQSFASAGQAAEQALSLLESGSVSTGIGQGFLGGIGEKTGMNSQTQQQYRSTVALARTAARNAMLGANMSEKELESMSAFIPEFNDAPNIAKTKLQTFVTLMNQFSQNFEGVTSTGQLPSTPAEMNAY
jgi:hypothetical protein